MNEKDKLYMDHLITKAAKIEVRHTRFRLAWKGKLVWAKEWTNPRAKTEYDELMARWRRLKWGKT